MSQSALWLLDTPDLFCLQRPVWRVVCLAAFSAIELGRKALWARSSSLPPSDPGSPDRLDLTSRIADTVVARFWFLLHDFALDRPAPPADWHLVSALSPFLRVVDGTVCVRSGTMKHA